MRRILAFLYIVLLVVMGAATILEKMEGTEYTWSHIYGSWWFVLLWALLAAFGIIWLVKRKVRRWPVVILHASLVLILLGALLTHLTAHKGMVHLRIGQQTNQYIKTDDPHQMAEETLPFTLQLDTFMVMFHDGTAAAADYISVVTLTDGDVMRHDTISMNNILREHNIRLYQSSYDDDGRGSILALNTDPWGVPVTYIGYALLFFSLIYMLIDPKGAFRQLLRHPALKRGVLGLLLIMGNVTSSEAASSTLPSSTADKFGRLLINYNDRICPLQTYAIDFTKKLTGRKSYQGLTAEQVLTGWLFYYEQWCAEPCIKVKGGELNHRLGTDGYASLNDFFDSTTGYKIGPLIQEYYQGNNDALHQQANKADEKLQLIMTLRQGATLRVLPYTDERGKTVWYSPADSIPDTVEAEHKKYITEVFSLMYQDVLAGHDERVNVFLDKMLIYQQQNGGNSLPSKTRVNAERLYNAIPFATILFMVCLTMGFLTLGYFMLRLTRRGKSRLQNRHDESASQKQQTSYKWVLHFSFAIMLLAFLALTLCLALRWVIRGTVPMGNGYETMLLMAWLIMLVSMLTCRWFSIVITFGFLLSGFFLLVAHISNMDPQITHLMPVLQSPLLSIHVSVIMTAYALLALTFLCGVVAVILRFMNRRQNDLLQEQLESLSVLSRLFLYPALTTLGLGIFIGAIWANISWGEYWSWDPKETWALITFMIYAVAAHRQSVPAMRRPMSYHVYMIFAFLSILMTYFGVNYLLGGMHSYA